MKTVKEFTDRVLGQIKCSLDKYVFIRMQKPYLNDNDYLNLLIKHELDFYEELVDKGTYTYNSLECTLRRTPGK